MLKNYFKIALRTLLRNKGFTAINIGGLAVGLATFLLIVFYVFDELSYDRYNIKADRIYRVNNEIKFGGSVNSYAVTPAPLAGAMKSTLPEIEQAVRLRMGGGSKVKKDGQNIQEDRMVYADPSLFSIFTLPIISGNAATALSQPHSVVITEHIAEKYFNTTKAVGKVLTFNDNELYKVTGVIKNMPDQSHFKFDFFIAMSTLAESRAGAWLSNNFNTYVLLKPGADGKELESKLQDFYKKEAGPELESILHLDFTKFEQAGNYVKVSMTPLKDIHLGSNRMAELGANSNIQYVYIFSAIALFILLIACVNFMNLSTARSSSRAREVGVRKVLGSPRKYLIAQFLIESMLITLAATIIALFIAWLALPYFNALSGKELIVTPQIMTWLLPVMLVIVVVIGCLAGAYPALFLSAFHPIAVLKGKISSGFKGGFLRSSLVVFQFAVSIFLIIGTLVIYNQLKYILNKDIGYDRDHVLVVRNVWALGNKLETFKQEVKQTSGVISVGIGDASPVSRSVNTLTMFKDKVPDQKRSISPEYWSVDEDYVPTLGIKMAAGRNFSRQMLTDSTGLLINEAAAKQLGFENPIDQLIYVPQDNQAKVVKPYHIVGVMKDFNFHSLRENVTPMMLDLHSTNGVLIARVNTADIGVLLTQLKKTWKDLSPAQPLNYSFMNDDFNALYRAEEHVGQIAVSFTLLAIIIACLGLFGLAAYAAEQRTKEIGIRKVLGASVSVLVGILSRDFIRLVCIAIIIASPLAWIAMQKWFLEGFAYRQDISWGVVALAGSGAIMIAFVTVSLQAIKAALADPVKSLRSE